MMMVTEQNENKKKLVSEDTEEGSRPRLYEVAYLVSPTIPEDKVGEVVARIRECIEKQGALVMFDEFPRFRQLAYTMVKPTGGKNEKYENAYFGWVKFESTAEAIGSIKDSLTADHDLIRFLIAKASKERKVTMRAPVWRRESPKAELERKSGGEKSVEVSDAEIDKTIEELIAE